MNTVKFITADIVDEDGKVLSRGVEVDVECDIVDMWKTVAGAEASEEAIPLLNVTYAVLQPIIDYCRHYIDHPGDIKWEEEFFRVPSRDKASLEEIRKRHNFIVSIAHGANYLDIPELYNASTRNIAYLFQNKTPHQIYEEWDLLSDLTSKEKEKIRRENMWTLDL